MYLLVLLLVIILLAMFWVGYQRLFRVRHLSRQRIIIGLTTAMVILTLMTIANHLGYLSQDVAAKFTMGLYSAATGFFSGYALKQFFLKQEGGYIEYAYRSFWTETAPNIISIILIAFGLYRTHLFTLGPFTGIGITSGLSLIAFGAFGLTIGIVPEFRQNGILILDHLVPWKKVVTYRWHNEEVIQIEYINQSNKLTDFTTFIPSEDELTIEKSLTNQLNKYESERTEEMENLNTAS